MGPGPEYKSNNFCKHFKNVSGWRGLYKNSVSSELGGDVPLRM
jgi:hypothetical protein